MLGTRTLLKIGARLGRFRGDVANRYGGQAAQRALLGVPDAAISIRQKRLPVKPPAAAPAKLESAKVSRPESDLSTSVKLTAWNVRISTFLLLEGR